MSKTMIRNNKPLPVTNADWEKLLNRVVKLPDDRVRDLYDAIAGVLDGKEVTNSSRLGFRLPKADDPPANGGRTGFKLPAGE